MPEPTQFCRSKFVAYLEPVIMLFRPAWQTRRRSFCLARAIEKLLLPRTPNFSFHISHSLRPVQPHPLPGPLFLAPAFYLVLVLPLNVCQGDGSPDTFLNAVLSETTPEANPKP